MYKGKIRGKQVYFDELSSIKYFDLIEDGDYETLEVLKSTNRSIVRLIKMDSKKFIYKIPHEKNTKKWQRFLSIFRSSESKREAEGIERILKNGFNSPKAYLVSEEIHMGMVFDSYILMDFIEGRIDNLDDIHLVGKTLNKIHNRGYKHGDPAMNNFIVKGEDVYIIDTKLNKLRYGKLGRIYEYKRLENSTDQNEIEIENYDKNSIWYRLVKRYDEFNINMRKHKLSLREKIKNMKKKDNEGDEEY